MRETVEILNRDRSLDNVLSSDYFYLSENTSAYCGDAFAYLIRDPDLNEIEKILEELKKNKSRAKLVVLVPSYKIALLKNYFRDVVFITDKAEKHGYELIENIREKSDKNIHFTQLEKKLLEYLSYGTSNDELVHALNISQRSLMRLKEKLRLKLNLESSTQLVCFATFCLMNFRIHNNEMHVDRE